LKEQDKGNVIIVVYIVSVNWNDN